jgi:glycosyltransferase involved in cell wall biosynthesis
MNSHIIIVSNTAWSIYNFRMGLIETLMEAGCNVTAMAPPDDYVPFIEESGCNFIGLHSLSQVGKSPINDLLFYNELRGYFRGIKPDAVLLFTPKPNIYGGMAAASLSIPYINTINGLGYMFQHNGLLTQVVKHLYKRGLRKSKRVFFQNKDDADFFQRIKILSADLIGVVPGSGVNTDYFLPVVKRYRKPVHFLLCARLVSEKGIHEYMQAAQVLKKKFPHALFRLIGKKAIHPSAVNEEIIKEYHNKGVIEYLGETDDIDGILNDIDVLVHPSYYKEGIPKILLEGLSKGLPVITTDSVGCRETVVHGENGLMIPPKDIKALTDAMHFMIKADKTVLSKMGQMSRKKAITEFSEGIVISHYLKELSFINRDMFSKAVENLQRASAQ